MKYERKCEECYGSGEVESVIQTCTRYRGDCCGGCTETIDCHDCDGQGYVEIDTDEELEDELAELESAIDDIYIKLNADGVSLSDIRKLIEKQVNEDCSANASRINKNK